MILPHDAFAFSCLCLGMLLPSRVCLVMRLPHDFVLPCFCLIMILPYRAVALSYIGRAQHHQRPRRDHEAGAREVDGAVRVAGTARPSPCATALPGVDVLCFGVCVFIWLHTLYVYKHVFCVFLVCRCLREICTYVIRAWVLNIKHQHGISRSQVVDGVSTSPTGMALIREVDTVHIRRH